MNNYIRGNEWRQRFERPHSRRSWKCKSVIQKRQTVSKTTQSANTPPDIIFLLNEHNPMQCPKFSNVLNISGPVRSPGQIAALVSFSTRTISGHGELMCTMCILSYTAGMRRHTPNRLTVRLYLHKEFYKIQRPYFFLEKQRKLPFVSYFCKAK
jgi:hypothetical protein